MFCIDNIWKLATIRQTVVFWNDTINVTSWTYWVKLNYVYIIMSCWICVKLHLNAKNVKAYSNVKNLILVMVKHVCIVLEGRVKCFQFTLYLWIISIETIIIIITASCIPSCKYICKLTHESAIQQMGTSQMTTPSTIYKARSFTWKIATIYHNNVQHTNSVLNT